MSTYFSYSFYIACELLVMPLHVSTLIGDYFMVDRVYQFCVVTFVGCDTWVDLSILDMINYDNIFGMD